MNKKKLILSLSTGVPVLAGLTSAVCLCTGCSCATYSAIPTDYLNISNDTLKGFKENVDYSKYTCLEIPSNVRNIEKSAFKDCFKAGSTVNTIKFSKNIRHLDDNVFEGCNGITTFDLSNLDEEAVKYINWGNNLFGTDETNKPVYINIKLNNGLTDSAKKELKDKLIAAGIPAASFAEKVTDKVEVKTENKTKEVSDSTKVEMTLTMTEEEKLTYVFKATAERDGGTPGVGVKLGEVKVEEITNETKKYKASVDAEIVNAKNNGDYVTYKIDMIAMSGEEVKWVQTIENFKLVYNKDTPAAIVHVTGVSLTPQELTIDVGEESELVETVAPSNATDKTVSWTSENPAIASVVGGKVTGVAVGTTNIKVKTTDGGFEATCAITVEEAPAVVEYKFVGYKEDGTETTVESEIAYYSVGEDTSETYTGKIVIPSTHNDKPVKVITSFKNNTDITNLTIPSSIEKIETGCFEGCSNLVSVKFKDLTGWTLKKDGAKKTWYTPTTDVEANATALVTTYSDREWTKGVEPMKTFTVSFSAGEGGTLDGSTSPISVEEGTKWSEITTPTPKPNQGYVFSKWVDQDGTEISSNTQISKDTQATAEFVAGGLVASFSADKNIQCGSGGQITVLLDGVDVTSSCKYSSNNGNIKVSNTGTITTSNTTLGTGIITITKDSKTTTMNLAVGSWNNCKVTKENDKYYLEKADSPKSQTYYLCSKYVDEDGEFQDLHFKESGFKETKCEYLTINDGFTEIPDSCFEKITHKFDSLTINLPNSLVKIGKNAFGGAGSSIQTMTLLTNNWFVNKDTPEAATIDSNFKTNMTTYSKDFCKYGLFRNV